MKHLILLTFLTLIYSISHSQKLYKAVEQGDTVKVKELINKGEDVNEYNKNGLFPLWRAASDNNIQMCKILIKNGANVMQKTKVSPGFTTPIVSIIQNGNLELLKLFIENKYDINFREYLGFTPLRLAAAKGQYDMVVYLISKGAEIDSKANDNATPLLHACSKGYYDIAEYLIKNGATVNLIDRDGESPLSAAAYSGNLEIVKLLLDNGADIHLKNSKDKTPIDMALEKGKKEAAEMMGNYKK
jgi:ankyrin repeat protein